MAHKNTAAKLKTITPTTIAISVMIASMMVSTFLRIK